MGVERDFKLFERASFLIMQEQAFFWQRFTSFITIHTGLFVLSTSIVVLAPTSPGTHQTRTGILCIAIVLAVAWIYIQRVSLHYVDRLKPQFHELREAIGLKYVPSPALLSSPRFSSTDVACVVPVLVLAVWISLLFV